MRYKDDMYFAHPILREGSDDYISAAFDSDFFHEVTETIISITSRVSLNCDALKSQLEKGEVGVGYYMMCRDTLQNRLVEVGLDVTVQDFPAANYFGTVLLRPVIWAKNANDSWAPENLNEEYGDGASYDRYDLLGIGQEVSFSVDQERLKPLESIFQYAPNEQVELNSFEVDVDGDKITIATHPDTKHTLDGIRNKQRGRIVLFNSIYLPVVMQVVSEIQQGVTQDLESKPWYRVFSAKCADAGIVDLRSVSAFDAAQRLLKSPFKLLDDHKEELF